jgi:hypothetical protein
VIEEGCVMVLQDIEEELVVEDATSSSNLKHRPKISEEELVVEDATSSSDLKLHAIMLVLEEEMVVEDAGSSSILKLLAIVRVLMLVF